MDVLLLASDHGIWEDYLDQNICSMVGEIRPGTTILWEKIAGPTICQMDKKGCCRGSWEDARFKLIASLVYCQILERDHSLLELITDYRGIMGSFDEKHLEYWVVVAEIIRDSAIDTKSGYYSNILAWLKSGHRSLGDMEQMLIEYTNYLYDQLAEKILNTNYSKVEQLLESMTDNYSDNEKICTKLFDLMASIRDDAMIDIIKKVEDNKLIVIVGHSHIEDLLPKLTKIKNITVEVSNKEANECEGCSYQTIKRFLER